MEALSALKRLQELLKEGAEPFAKRVMMEIANPDIVGRSSSHDDHHASTPLLRELQEGAELIRVEVLCFLLRLRFILFCVLKRATENIVNPSGDTFASVNDAAKKNRNILE